MFKLRFAIAKEIRALYPKIKIYPEKVESNMQLPAFFIERTSTRSNPLLFGRNINEFSFQVVYFPKNEHSNEELEDVEDYLMINLKNITNIATMKNREFIKQDNCLIYNFELILLSDPEITKNKLEKMYLNERID